MYRYLLVSMISFGLCTLAVGQLPEKGPPGITKDATGPGRVPELKPGRSAFLANTPPAPVPALKHELLPASQDLLPGNAAVGYMRGALLLPAWPREAKASQAQQDKLDRWMTVPLDQFPVADVKKFLESYRQTFKSVNEAANMTRCDWNEGRQPGPIDLGSTLPTIQNNRDIMRYLRLRQRLELAENRIPDAIRTIQTGFRMGQHVGEGSTMIEMLVGIALVTITIDMAEQVIAHPQGPNLYWALTTLPDPLINPRKAINGELAFTMNLIPELKKMEAGPIHEDDALQLYQQLLKNMASAGAQTDADFPPRNPLANLGLGAMMALQTPAAREELIQRGWEAAVVEKMPAAQVLILRNVALHRETWDDQVKLFFVPYPMAVKELQEAGERQKNLRTIHRNRMDPIYQVFGLLYPAMDKVYHSHARVGRRIAQLRVVEAVRLHAALNNQQLPASLDEITAVPVPHDPWTLKPFEYRVEGNTFRLFAPAPAGETPAPHTAHEYVVTLRK